MLAIIKMTFRESFSRKVLLISLILAAIFLGFYGMGVHFVRKDLNDPMLALLVYPQLLSLGLYFGGFIVSFLAIFTSVGAISSEIENGIIQTVIPKPIPRRDIIIGKFFGLGLFLSLYAVMFFAVIVLIIQSHTSLELVGQWRAMALFVLQPLVLMAVTLSGSVLLSTIANGVVMFMLYSIAIIGGMLEQIGWVINNTAVKQAGIVASLIMPVDALYRKINHVLLSSSDMAAQIMMGPFGSFSEPSMWMVVYAAIYIIFFTSLAVYFFNRKDI